MQEEMCALAEKHSLTVAHVVELWGKAKKKAARESQEGTAKFYAIAKKLLAEYAQAAAPQPEPEPPQPLLAEEPKEKKGKKSEQS